jgi:uncharacterized protein (TIGR03437 family)
MFLTWRNACVGLMMAEAFTAIAAAQTSQFDSSANAKLQGNYFVREVLLTSPNPNGTVGTAIGATGTLTFDGAGDYVFNGAVTVCSTVPCSAPQPATSTITGNYNLASNGFFEINSLVGTYKDNNGQTQVDLAFGGVGVAGPNAFVASATEATNYDLFIGIPLNASATNASFKGTFNTAYLDFLQGDVTKVRDATYSLAADGQGNLTSTQMSGYAANLGSTAQPQYILPAGYSLSSLTVTGGALNFGSSSNLISGSKAFLISPDGTLILGGSLTDFDMLVGTPAVANATDALYSGFYFIGAQEDNASSLASEGLSSIDTLYGSISATGNGGFYINHLRFSQPGYYPYDWTYNADYNVPASGIFQPGGEADQYMLGPNGQIVIGCGTGTYYSLVLGLQAPSYTYSGSGVSLNPLGIVNAANYAPATNPVAPLEMVVLFGGGIAPHDWDATTFPLPTMTPDGVQVLINGTAAPLFKARASSQLLYALVPSSISPANGVYYATFQVKNIFALSNSVTLYTNYTAPGVFAASEGGVGDAAALHASSVYSPITAASPAHVNETVELFLDVLGSVNPPITPDGAPALSASPFNLVTANTTVALDNIDSTLPFVGMAPGYTGLYQVNATIPTVTANDWYLNVNAFDQVGLDGGYTSEATIEVAGASSGASGTGFIRAAQPPLRAGHHGAPRASGAKPVSGRLPHIAQ